MPVLLKSARSGWHRTHFAVVLVCLGVTGMAGAGDEVAPSPRLMRLPPPATFEVPASLVPQASQPLPAEPDPAQPLPAEPDPAETVVADPAWGGCHVRDWLTSASIPRANSSCDGQRWLSNYGSWIHDEVGVDDHERIEDDSTRMLDSSATQLPPTVHVWWDQPVREPSAPALHVAIAPLIEGALNYSSYVQMVATEPWIRRTSVVEQQAAFDWRGFLETTYTDTNEPVGNTLTTGTNDDRYKDRNWSVVGGVRQDNRLGGNIELFQRLGGQQNNSRFLLPNPQSASQLELRYTQPLLNGAGCAYNESRIVLAQILANMSSDELIDNLQEHLFKVTDAYWELYRARAEYFQRLKLLTSARMTLEILEGRATLDAVQRQILRARAAVATRQSEMARAQTSIRNAESRLRFLVNDPVLLHAGGQELAPAESPLIEAVPLAMDESLYTALQHRPDISKAIRDVRSASVRLGVAQKDILPKLDLVASTYVAGLATQTNVARSFGSQFDAGRPSFSAGFVFEVPFGRRAAFAEENRRRWELQRAFSQFRLTVEEALTRVELAVREVETSYREMAGKYHAMIAVANEADYLFDRWRTLPGADDSAVLLLENLLDAQERVAEEEASMTRSMVSYAMSFVRLKQEMGTLMIVSPICNYVMPAGPAPQLDDPPSGNGQPELTAIDPPQRPTTPAHGVGIPNW